MRWSFRRRRGAALLETALWLPVLVLLFMGTVELARLTYTYYSLQKMLNTLARDLSAQPFANFCDPADPAIERAKDAMVHGIPLGNGAPIVPVVQGLDTDMIEVRVQRYSRESGNLSDCDCSATAGTCNTAFGGRGPDFLAVSIPGGYPMRLRIPGLSNEPVPLRPRVLVPLPGL